MQSKRDHTTQSLGDLESVIHARLRSNDDNPSITKHLLRQYLDAIVSEMNEQLMECQCRSLTSNEIKWLLDMQLRSRYNKAMDQLQALNNRIARKQLDVGMQARSSSLVVFAAVCGAVGVMMGYMLHK